MATIDPLQEALVCQRAGDWLRARDIYETLLKSQPRHVDALNQLGIILAQTGNPKRAVVLFDRAIAAEPPMQRSWSWVGSAGLEHWVAALESLNRALVIRPGFPEACFNRGTVLMELNRLHDALESYNQAISLRADYAGGVSEPRRGAQGDLGQLEAAVATSIEPFACAPVTRAPLDKSFALLLRGDFTQGWPLYEWRRKDERVLTQPRWLGDESIAGKTILLHAEQGFGDTLQFCRYATLVSGLGARVIVEVQPPLRTLLSSLRRCGADGRERHAAAGFRFALSDHESAAGVQDDARNDSARTPLFARRSGQGCGLAQPARGEDAAPGRPGVERQRDQQARPQPQPRVGTVVAASAAGAVLRELAEGVARAARHWRERLGEHNRFRIGLVWSSGVRPDEPEMRAANRRRNIPLSKLAALKDPRIEFYSLQKGQLAELELVQSMAEWGPAMKDFTSELQDFADTAALMEQLDLIVSVDTSTAHLAGALGKPVWILLRSDACWRWLLDRTDSPWYPTARLYRQERPGDWDGVVQRVKRDLEALARRSVSPGIAWHTA